MHLFPILNQIFSKLIHMIICEIITEKYKYVFISLDLILVLLEPLVHLYQVGDQKHHQVDIWQVVPLADNNHQKYHQLSTQVFKRVILHQH